MRVIPSIGTPIEGGGVGQGENRGSTNSACCGVFGLSLVPCYGARIFRKRTDRLDKVDREERPDIDEIYISEIQAMSGQGGWPMQNMNLKNNDIVYVPRSFIGDVNDVITKIEPLLNVLLIPLSHRDLYTTDGGLRVDTGDPAASSTTQGFSRPLPGTGGVVAGKEVVVPEEEEEQGEDQ